MITTRKQLQAASLVALLTLVGCAPTFSNSPFGNGVQIGISSGGALNLASPNCSLTGMASAEAGVVRTTGASMAFSIMQRVSALQAKYALGGHQINNPESWKRIAGGGC